jgi:hypothetical protein
MCRFPNPLSSADLLTCDDASCLTPCHRAFVSLSCHFFRTRRTARDDTCSRGLTSGNRSSTVSSRDSTIKTPGISHLHDAISMTPDKYMARGRDSGPVGPYRGKGIVKAEGISLWPVTTTWTSPNSSGVCSPSRSAHERPTTGTRFSRPASNSPTSTAKNMSWRWSMNWWQSALDPPP